MKHTKKLFTLLMAVCMAAILSISACAANEGTPAESPVISPRSVEIEDNIRASNGTYTSTTFQCPSANGNTLRIFYRDESGNAANVVLQKQGYLRANQLDL